MAAFRWTFESLYLRYCMFLVHLRISPASYEAMTCFMYNCAHMFFPRSDGRAET